MSNRVKAATVAFTSENEGCDAYPPVALGDVLSDLPEVENEELQVGGEIGRAHV